MGSQMKKYVNDLQCWNKLSVALKKTSELVEVFEENKINIRKVL